MCGPRPWARLHRRRPLGSTAPDLLILSYGPRSLTSSLWSPRTFKSTPSSVKGFGVCLAPPRPLLQAMLSTLFQGQKASPFREKTFLKCSLSTLLPGQKKAAPSTLFPGQKQNSAFPSTLFPGQKQNSAFPFHPVSRAEKDPWSPTENNFQTLHGLFALACCSFWSSSSLCSKKTTPASCSLQLQGAAHLSQSCSKTAVHMNCML